MLQDSERALNLTLADIGTLSPDEILEQIAENTRIRIEGSDDWRNAAILIDHIRDLSDGHVALLGCPTGWRCYFGTVGRPANEGHDDWMPKGAVEAICRAALCVMANVDPAES